MIYIQRQGFTNAIAAESVPLPLKNNTYYVGSTGIILCYTGSSTMGMPIHKKQTKTVTIGEADNPAHKDSPDKGATFTLVPMSSIDNSAFKLKGAHIHADEDGFRMYAYQGLRFGISNWDGITDDDGNPIPFEKDKKGRVKTELIDKINENSLLCMLAEVMEFNNPSTEELGK